MDGLIQMTYIYIQVGRHYRIGLYVRVLECSYSGGGAFNVVVVVVSDTTRRYQR